MSNNKIIHLAIENTIHRYVHSVSVIVVTKTTNSLHCWPSVGFCLTAYVDSAALPLCLEICSMVAEH
jgi:hypothetical protein